MKFFRKNNRPLSLVAAERILRETENMVQKKKAEALRKKIANKACAVLSAVHADCDSYFGGSYTANGLVLEDKIYPLVIGVSHTVTIQVGARSIFLRKVFAAHMEGTLGWSVFTYIPDEYWGKALDELYCQRDEFRAQALKRKAEDIKRHFAER